MDRAAKADGQRKAHSFKFKSRDEGSGVNKQGLLSAEDIGIRVWDLGFGV